jgi:TatD DNase family protein
MIDSHCHLTDPRLHEQLRQVLDRAAGAGVEGMITIGTDPADARRAIDVCRAHPNVRCAVGVHPNQSHEVDPNDLPLLRDLQADRCVVALGEMGLDYHHHFADRSRQHEYFRWQLSLAAELNRPVIIHCREAVDDCLSIMSGFAGVPAVFHCFTGSVEEGLRIVEKGYLLGFTGVVTFKNSESLRELVRKMPADRILVETDAPYLSPEPVRRQKINEPALVMHTAAMIAQVRQIPIEEVDRITTENVQRFFGWP